MTTKITVTAATLVVEPVSLDRLWSFTRRLEVPLTHVRGATYDPEAAGGPKGLRHPGLAAPGKWAGTFTHDGDTSFWNVTGHRRTIVVQLRDEAFQRLYLSVDDPRSAVDLINSVVRENPVGHADSHGQDVVGR